MKYFRLKFSDGTQAIVKGKNSLAVIKEHNLCTREHINTRIIELEGEQLAIAKGNDVYNGNI